MLKMGILAVACVAVSLQAAGCFSPCGYGADKRWSDTDLYGRMPPDGKYGDSDHIRVGRWDTNRSVIGVGGDPPVSFGMTVRQDGGMHWYTGFKHYPDNDQIAERLNYTFSELGLGVPTVPNWNFEISHGC
jgi:hypothetical protein